jgi:manganese/zinc/iron transport system ATP- binding protein
MTHTPSADFTAPLAVEALTVAYANGVVALRDLTVALPPARLTAIYGPNGAGKSTFLKAALGLIPAQRGRVAFWGQPFEEVRHRVAYVPQRAEIDWTFPITVRDVALQGRAVYRRWYQAYTRHDRDHAEAALEAVGLLPLRSRHISQLSGGQQQRLFVARALAQQPDLLLLDEPFAAIDLPTEHLLIDLFRNLTQAGTTVALIHHDIQVASRYFDHLIFLNQTLRYAGSPVEVRLSDLYTPLAIGL